MKRTAYLLKTNVLIGFACVLGSLAHAQNTIELIDGSRVEATIDSVSADGTVTGTGIPAGITLEKIVTYQTDLQNVPRESTEILVAGLGQIFTNSITIEDTTATLAWPDGSPNLVPLELIGAVVYRRTELVNKRLATRSDSEDSVVVDTTGGEKVVSGIFEGLTEGKLGLNFNGKSRKIGVEKINAISLADLGLKLLTGAEVELANGSKLNGRLKSVKDGRMLLAMTNNHTIEVPWAIVKRIEIQSDNLVYLSALEPTEVEQKTMFAPARNWQRDRSVELNPIRLQDPQKTAPRTYRKGIGTQSFSELTFANTNQFERFQATAGIDAETQGQGNCQMSVYADGIKLWSQQITAQSAPVEIDVDITGMQAVTLIVEPGEQFDLADHADWADAKFVKQ